MKECIRDTKAVFVMVTTNDNVLAWCVSLDSATSVMKALQALQASGHQMLPRLVLLSSATIDEPLSRDMPSWTRCVLLASASRVYEDLRRTEAMLRLHADWLFVVFVKPADAARGHRLILDEEESSLGDMDLVAGMIAAVGDEKGQYRGRNVGVVNKTSRVGAKFPRGTPLCVLM